MSSSNHVNFQDETPVASNRSHRWVIGGLFGGLVVFGLLGLACFFTSGFWSVVLPGALSFAVDKSMVVVPVNVLQLFETSDPQASETPVITEVPVITRMPIITSTVSPVLTITPNLIPSATATGIDKATAIKIAVITNTPFPSLNYQAGTVLGTVNVRAGPSPSNRVIGALYSGDRVTVRSQSGNWLEVVYLSLDKPPVQGWIFSKLVQLDE